MKSNQDQSIETNNSYSNKVINKKNIALKVSELSRNVKENHLKEIFSLFGKIKKVEVAIHQRAKLPLGFGIVVFDREEEAKIALKRMHGGQIDGRVISVK